MESTYCNVDSKIARSRRRARDIHSREVQGLANVDSSLPKVSSAQNGEMLIYKTTTKEIKSGRSTTCVTSLYNCKWPND